MQKIVVKEIRGPLGKGEKKFYSIKDDKDGEFTSFDTKLANIKPGSVLEAEIEVSGKYVNLKEWKLISEPEGQPQTNGKLYKRDTEGIDFEYQWKAKLQEIERHSIEAQTAYNGIMGLAAKYETPNHISGKFGEVYALAIEWAKARLEDTATKPIPIPISTAPESVRKPIEKETNGKVFPNVGALLKWCFDNGITRAKFMEIIKVKENDIAKVNIQDAHTVILDYLKEHPAEPQNPEQLFK